MLAKKGQKAFEREYPTLSFREIFGINYIAPEERDNAAQKAADLGEGADGFTNIPDGIDEELPFS